MLLALSVLVSASHQVSAHIAGHGDKPTAQAGHEIASIAALEADHDHGHSHDFDEDTSDATCLDHDSVDHDHPVGILILSGQPCRGEATGSIPGPPLSCLPAHDACGERPPSLVGAV